MNAARLLAWVVLPLVGLVLVGALAIWLLKALLGLAIYLIVGAAVVGAGVLVYRRVQRSIGPGTRNRNRIEAAARTYRIRKSR
jgi:O-antigen/teichoic acid export membrane protein